MSDHGRREVRLMTGACLIVAGAGVASSVSPAIAAGLNLWVGIPLAAGGGLVLAGLLVRSLWLSLLIDWEVHRPLHPDEIPGGLQTMEGSRDA